MQVFHQLAKAVDFFTIAYMGELNIGNVCHSKFIDLVIPKWRTLVVAAWTLYFMINNAMPTEDLITVMLLAHNWIFPCQLVTHPTAIRLDLVDGFAFDQISDLPHTFVF